MTEPREIKGPTMSDKYAEHWAVGSIEKICKTANDQLMIFNNKKRAEDHASKIGAAGVFPIDVDRHGELQEFMIALDWLSNQATGWNREAAVVYADALKYARKKLLEAANA